MTRVLPPPDAYAVRGWCPSARRPMATGDGLIVRLDTQRVRLSPAHLIAIASIAELHGNGLIDLTQRANVQLRGVKQAGLPAMWRALDAIGMLASASEVPSNILTAPLAGIDNSEALDSSVLAAALARALAAAPDLAALPAKFAFLVDGGGVMPLDDAAADIRLRAFDAGGNADVAVGINRADGARWLGSAAPEAAVEAAVALAKAYLHARAPAQRRMRDLPDAVVASMLATQLPLLPGAPAIPYRAATHPLGIVRDAAGRIVCVGMAAGLGRIQSSDLRRLADAAEHLDVASIAVSPWRSLYAVTSAEGAAATLADVAASLGLIIDERHPLLAVDACPGAPACSSSSVDTHRAAHVLAPQLKTLGLRSCHISGCSKGCARAAPADMTLVGTGGSFALVRDGTARSAPQCIVPQEAVAELQRYVAPD